jgi:hypothetical protein
MENYENARPLLDQLLSDYLARWIPVLPEEVDYSIEEKTDLQESPPLKPNSEDLPTRSFSSGYQGVEGSAE